MAEALVASTVGGRLDEHHQRRVRRMLQLCSGIAGFGGLGWALFFGVRGDWLVVAIELGVVLASGGVAALARAGRLRAASRGLVGAM
jgi:hypothetical protein